jgi:hypothetical protein
MDKARALKYIEEAERPHTKEIGRGTYRWPDCECVAAETSGLFDRQY